MQKAVIFGAGEFLKDVLSEIKMEYEVLAIADNNNDKHNTLFEKYLIIEPQNINDFNFDVVIVTSRNYAAQIISQLLHLGIPEEKVICDYVASIRRIYVKDLLSMQINERGKFNRVDIQVKYNVIKETKEEKCNTFKEVYKKMQQERLCISHQDAENRLQKFQELTDSIELGWEDSEENCIVCDERLQIIDGAHRLACCLYYGVSTINIRVVSGNSSTAYSMNWFWEHGFDIAIIDRLELEIAKLLTREFIIFLWPTVSNFFEEITNDIVAMAEKDHCEFLNVKDICYHTNKERNMAIRTIYSVDDIAKWKIEAKTQHIQGNKIRIISLKTNKPEYRIKQATGLPLAVFGEEIKKGIRGRYKDRVDNYFFDNIIHISDNEYQTKLIGKKLSLIINLSAYFNAIENMNYVLLKTDVPYMPVIFPKDFAVGKDLDLLCSIEDMDRIIKKSQYYAYQFALKNDLTVRSIKDINSCRIRMEYFNCLILQIDIRSSYEDINKEFFIQAFQHIRCINGYKILENQYEAVIRFEEVLKNPDKDYHQDWLSNHLSYVDINLIRKYLKYEQEIIDKCWLDFQI